MSTEAKATGYLELDLTGFDQAIKSAKKMLGGLAAGFAAFKTVEFFKDGIADAVNLGKEMQVASNKMGGFDVGKMLIVQKALEKAGLGAEEARGAISDFVNEGRDLAVIFGGADNYAKALKSAAADYGKQADVLTRSSKALQTVWNTLESISSKMRTFFLTMTEQFVRPLQAALDYLNQMDLAGMGTAFGESIAKATTLMLGLFKNGDVWNMAKLGMTIAFQEAINYLVGAFNWVTNNIVPKIGDYLGDAFLTAVEYMKKALGFIFSGEELMRSISSLAFKMTAALLGAVNVFAKAIGAATSLAVLHAIDSIPGASKMMGLPDEVASFDELYKDTDGIVSDKFINDMKEVSELVGGTSLADFMKRSGIMEGSADDAFKKADIFKDTGDLKKEFADTIGKAFETGRDMVDKSGKNNKPAEILNTLSGGGAHVIADSLAKVGGGGNSLKVGMSLAERSALRTAMATEQTAKATEAIAQGVKEGKPLVITRMGR